MENCIPATFSHFEELKIPNAYFDKYPDHKRYFLNLPAKRKTIEPINIQPTGNYKSASCHYIVLYFDTRIGIA